MAPSRVAALGGGAAILLLALAFGACASSKTIAELRADPATCRDEPVTVEGEVSEHLSLALAGVAYYQISDASGQIWVQSLEAVPPVGEEVRVTGVCTPGIKVGSFELGLILRERRRS